MNENKRGRYPSSLLVKVIIFNIICIFVLTLFNQVIFYQLIDSTYRRNFTKFSLANLDLSFGNIDSQIFGGAYSAPLQYFSDIPVNRPLLAPRMQDISKNPAAILNLQTHLMDIPSNYPFLSGMDVYYPATRTIATGFRAIHFPVTEKERDRLLPWYSDFLASGKDSLLLPLSRNNYPDGLEALTYITRIPQFRLREAELIVALHINPASFGEYIDDRSGRFLILGAAEELLYENTPAGEETSLYPTALAFLQGHADGLPDGIASFDLDTQDGSMVMVTAKAEKFGLRYLFILPYQSFYEDYQTLIHLLLLLCIATLVTNLAAVALLARRNNRTYRERVVALSKNAGVVVAQDVRTLDESLEHLVTQLSTLNSEMESARPALYQNFVRALIFGRIKREEYDRLLPMLPYRRVYCIIIDLCGGAAQDAAALSSLEGVQNEGPFCLLPTTLESGELAAILTVEEGREEESAGWLCTQLGNRLKGCRLTLGNSYETGPENIRRSFSEAELTHRYRYVFPKRPVLSPSDIHFETLKNTGSHLKIFSQVERGIVSGSYEEAAQRVCYLVEAFKSGGYGVDYCISTLRDFIALLHKLTESFGMDMWVVFGYDIRAYFEQIPDIDAFLEWVLELCRIISKNLEERKRAHPADFSEELIRMIDENLENDISLESLSDALGLRADVLSRTFKSAVGMNYSEYIKERKMKRAVELLAEGNTVKAIAERLGYGSTQYFIKVFKSIYGETPRQYQKNHS